jgi:GTPase involved in cell partitioning and DNA repair
MKIVKNYRENFLEEFKNDKPKILNLMKESNLRIFNLNEILEEIDNLGEEIKRNKGEIIPNKIIPLKRDEESIILETNSLNEEIKEKEKLIVNLEENKKKLIEDINFSFKEKN